MSKALSSPLSREGELPVSQAHHTPVSIIAVSINSEYKPHNSKTEPTNERKLLPMQREVKGKF